MFGVEQGRGASIVVLIRYAMLTVKAEVTTLHAAHLCTHLAALGGVACRNSSSLIP